MDPVKPLDGCDICGYHIRFDVVCLLLEGIELPEQVQIGILNVLGSKLVIFVLEEFASLLMVLEQYYLARVITCR